MRYITISVLLILGLNGCGTSNKNLNNVAQESSIPQPPTPHDINKQPPAIPDI